MAAELVLASVTTVLKAVYEEAEQASENKEALMSLAIKSRDVLAPQLSVIQNKLKGSKADHVLPALTFLDTCLRNVSALIKKRGKKRAAMQLPLDTIKRRAAKVKAEIAGAETNLFQALQMISSALQISCMQIIQDNFGDAAKDSESNRYLKEQPWKLRFEDLKYETTQRGRPVQSIRLGSGGFGLVFRATYQPDGREVAVKEPHDPAELHANNVLREAFLREAHNHYKLLHPNVVTMIGGLCISAFMRIYANAHTRTPTHTQSLSLSHLQFVLHSVSQFLSFLFSLSLSLSLILSLSFSRSHFLSHTHSLSSIHAHTYTHARARARTHTHTQLSPRITTKSRAICWSLKFFLKPWTPL